MSLIERILIYIAYWCVVLGVAFLVNTMLFVAVSDSVRYIVLIVVGFIAGLGYFALTNLLTRAEDEDHDSDTQ